MANVNVEKSAVNGAKSLCNYAMNSFSRTSKELSMKYQQAGYQWQDDKYRQLGQIVGDCNQSLQKSVLQLEDCSLPYALNLKGEGQAGLAIEMNPESSGQDYNLIYTLMGSFLSQLPLQRAKIAFCDSEGRGANAGPFMTLKHRTDDLIDLLRSESEIKQGLKYYNSLIDQRIPEIMANKTEDMISYNENAALKGDYSNGGNPLHLLVIHGFPKDLKSFPI